MPDSISERFQPQTQATALAAFAAARSRFLAAFDAMLTDSSIEAPARGQEAEATVSALKQLAWLRGGDNA